MHIEYTARIALTGHDRDRDRRMAHKDSPARNLAQPSIYQIRIQGHLGPQWTDWFGGLTITHEDNGETLLRGLVIDQAALYGLLRTVRDLGMPLLSVIRVEPGQTDPSNVKH